MKNVQSTIMTRLKALTVVTLLALLPASFGCSGAFKLKEPPQGYAVVNDGYSHLRAKARDNVGLNIASFYNVEGGTLDYWGSEMVEKLGKRGYTLTAQKPVTSRNKVAGTQFDFRYTPAGDETEKFYTAILFVSDERRVVVQFAGDASLAHEHRAEADAIVGLLKIRGCKATTDVCDGPQPPTLTTPKVAAAVEEEPEAAPEPEPEAEPTEPKEASG